jgi:hypothetical protein
MRSLSFRPLLVALVAFTTAPFNSAAAADPLQNLAEDEKRTLVLAALKERDRAIANLKYTLKEEMTNIGLDDGARRPLGHRQVGLRRHPASGYRVHTIDYEADGSFTSEWYFNSKGNEHRTLSRRGKDGPWIGSFRASNSHVLSNCALNQLLGFRILDDGRTLLQWLESSVARGRRVEFTSLHGAGRPLIDVSVYHGLERRTFHLDPARGWMAVRMEYRYQFPDGRYNKEHTDVVQATEVGGLWLPLRAVRLSGTSATRVETEYVYAVSKIEVGHVTEADLDIVFPPHCVVHNFMTREKFRTDADGRLVPVDAR